MSYTLVAKALIVTATAMTRGEYNTYRGWTLPANEDGDDAGYLMQYSNPTHENWLPSKMVDVAFSANGGYTFGQATALAKKGRKVARSSWNTKNVFIVHMPALYLPPYNTEDTARKVNDRTAKWIGEDKPLDCKAYFAMYNAKEQWIPGWSASQADMLAEDWYVVE